MRKSACKCIVLLIMLTGIFCISGCGAATMETVAAEAEANTGAKEKLLEESSAEENLGEDSKAENRAEESSPEEEISGGNGLEDEMAEL